MAKEAWKRASGVNTAEERVALLCDKAFLRLWSYPNPFKSPGDEICDLLSIFENNVLLFEVKKVGIDSSYDVEKAWRRWFNNAIKKGARKLDSAQRQLSRYPDKIYLDNKCTKLVPVALPRPPDARFFRIVVALGAAERIRTLDHGVSGLQIQPSIVGDYHLPDNNPDYRPFTVGWIGSDSRYTHVLDDSTLNEVLEELDTINDLIGYLKAKEDLIANGRLMFAPSELDLLADYVYPREGKAFHQFSDANSETSLTISPGLWASLQEDPFYRRRKDENRISFVWDQLIEHGSQDFVAFGGAPGRDGPTYAEAESVFRYMARENRFQRRLLGGEVLGMLENTARTAADRHTRTVESSFGDGTYFVIQALASNRARSQEDYRAFRRQSLEAACAVTKLTYPDALRVVGIATDMWPNHLQSIDVTYLDFAKWGDKEASRARRLNRIHRFTRNSQRSASSTWEYPDPSSPAFSAPFRAAPKVVSVQNPNEAWRSDQKGADRNRPCHCGSGRKAKHCCLARRESS